MLFEKMRIACGNNRLACLLAELHNPAIKLAKPLFSRNSSLAYQKPVV